MYIRRKVFSILTDEMGEERLYSVNETVLEGFEYDEVEQREFAKKRSDLEDYNSARGYGRGVLLGGSLTATAAGIRAGRKAAIKADEKGKSDYQIEAAAKSAGTKTGAKVGAALGAVSALGTGALIAKKRGIPLKSLGKYASKAVKTRKGAAAMAALAALPVAGAVSGAISGRSGASKNVRSSLEQRSKRDTGVKKVMGVED